MADETLTVELRTLAKLDGIKSAIDGLKDVQKEGSKAQQGLSGAFSGFQKSLSGIPSALGAVAAGFVSIRAVAGFLSDSVSEAVAAEKTLNRLTVALEATGEASARNVQDFQTFAQGLQSVTRFGDELILEQVALAKNFGLTNEAAKSLVKSAADLAAVTGKDLNAATEDLLKSLTGQLPRDLKLLGIDFANLTEAQLKAGAAQDLLNQKFGGRAAAEVKTLSGSYEQFKNTLSDAQEEIGKTVVSSGILQNIIISLTNATKRIAGLETDAEKLARFRKELELTGDAARKFILNKQILEIEAKVKTDTFKQAAAEVDEAISQSKLAARGGGIEIEVKVDQGAVAKVLADLKNVGRSAVEIAKQERDERLKILAQAFGGEDNINRLSVENRKLYADAKFRIEKDLQTKITSEQQKAGKEQDDALRKRLQIFKEASSNLGKSFSEIFTSAKSGKGINNSLLSGTALGVGKAITEGAAGGRTLLGAGVQGVGTALGGPAGGEIGAAIAPIIQELSKGKEAAKAFVTEFLNSIPDMILGLVEGIGAAAQAFSEQIPVIIDRFIEGLPRVITSLAESMPRVAVALSVQMPLVAVNFATSLISEAPKIAEAIIKAIGNAPGQAIGGVGKILGFAEGGSFVQRVPAGKGNGTSERQFALLGSGELVVSQTLSNRLDNFLANNEQADGGGSAPEGLMEKLDALINRPVVVNIDGREVFRAVRRQERAGMVF